MVRIDQVKRQHHPLEKTWWVYVWSRHQRYELTGNIIIDL